jgi:hypothetical protein
LKIENGKLKSVVLALLWLSSLAIAIPGDFDADGCVSAADLQHFAAGWLTSSEGDLDGDSDTDIADFAIFASHWIEGCIGTGTPPVANSGTSSPVTHIWQPITLSAADDGNPSVPGKLKYIITQLPTVGMIYDPKSGAGKIDHVPYTLSSWGNAVSYWTTTAGADSLKFAADDFGVTPMGGQSSPATVTITAAANPKDCLSFDGRGYVVFQDNDYYDADNGWAVHCFVKTTNPNGGIISKRGSTGPGWQIDLVGGKPIFRLWDTTGQQTTLTADWLTKQYFNYNRLDDGQWYELSACLFMLDGVVYATLQVGCEDIVEPVIAAGDYTNSEPVTLGKTAMGGYRGNIDKLRFFSNYVGGIYGNILYDPINPRTGDLNEVILFAGVASVVLFPLNEGTGTTISDIRASHLAGTIYSLDHVSWLPYFDPFMDVSVQQNYRGTK